jgi:hypothetical protein
MRRPERAWCRDLVKEALTAKKSPPVVPAGQGSRCQRLRGSTPRHEENRLLRVPRPYVRRQSRRGLCG